MSNSKGITKIIEDIGWGKFNIYLYSTCSLCCFLIFYGAALGSITIKEAKKDWDVSKLLLAQIGTSQLFGIFVGSFFWGQIGNHLGRVLVIRYCVGISFLTYLLFTFSINLYMAVAIIFIQGFGFAGLLGAAAPIYLEFCPSKQAWTTVLLTWVMYCGFVVANIIALLTVVIGDLGIDRWRWVSGVGALISLIVLAMSYWLIESPRFLDLKGKTDEAQIVLNKIAKWNGLKDPLLLEKQINTYASNIPAIETDESMISDFTKPTEKVQFSELFSKHHIKKSIALAMMGFLGDLGYFGLLEFMPYFLSSIPNKVTNDARIYETIIAQIAIGSLGPFLSSKLVETSLGRKWTVIISYLCCGVFSFLFLIADSYWIVLGSTVLIYFFNATGFSAFFLMTPENFPTNIRAFGVSWVNGISKFGGFLAPFTLGFLIEVNGGVIIGIVLISVSFGFVAACGLLVKETKGKKLDSAGLSDTVKE